MARSSKTVIVSAINLSEGGPLTVLRECLSAATRLPPEFRIIALVHNRQLFDLPRVRFLEFPRSKKSWLHRLFYEYVYFKHLSRRLKPMAWFSLHDITPRVTARLRAVYCHNPSPFYKISAREARLEPNFLLFNLFYKYLYKLNIKKNDFVVVQQAWLRKEFSSFFDQNRIIVAHPTVIPLLPSQKENPKRQDGKFIFLYPALPRIFKNVELLCQAVEMLPGPVRDKLELRLTLSGHENPYSQELLKRYGHIPAIQFIGRQSREALENHYADCNVVVFPSKLETWGLPITEAKSMGKPLLVADMLYARETVGEYEAVTFLPPDDASTWSQAISHIVTNRWKFGTNSAERIKEPYAANWHQLWHLLTQGLEQRLIKKN